MTKWLLAAALVLSGCAARPPGPVALALGEDACASCRMTIVSRATAAQIVRAGDEPVLFDELGCLREYLAQRAIPDDAVIYVADHRTGEWVNARAAVFTNTTVSTPMASGLLAHADASSRDADPAAAGGSPATVIP